MDILEVEWLVGAAEGQGSRAVLSGPDEDEEPERPARDRLSVLLLSTLRRFTRAPLRVTSDSARQIARLIARTGRAAPVRPGGPVAARTIPARRVDRIVLRFTRCAGSVRVGWRRRSDSATLACFDVRSHCARCHRRGIRIVHIVGCRVTGRGAVERRQRQCRERMFLMSTAGRHTQ
jgi:hypothetical protein